MAMMSLITPWRRCIDHLLSQGPKQISCKRQSTWLCLAPVWRLWTVFWDAPPSCGADNALCKTNMIQLDCDALLCFNWGTKDEIFMRNVLFSLSCHPKSNSQLLKCGICFILWIEKGFIERRALSLKTLVKADSSLFYTFFWEVDE